MLITSEILEKHKACKKGVDYMRHFYPNGAEMIDIIKDPKVDKEMLHWGRQNLDHSAEELAAYCEVCNIVNSQNFWRSINIDGCNHVVKSEDVKNCERIFYSGDVVDSFDVVNSESIDNSTQIFSSSFVSKSCQVAHSANITDSENVCFSSVVARSVSIFKSKNVFDSSEIIHGTDVTDSYFCRDCRKIRHCMFCDGLEDVEYYVFNKPVSKERFEIFVQQYKRFMQTSLTFTNYWPNHLIHDWAPTFTQKIDCWYKSIPDKFWKWATTLPEYDEMALYNMTLLSSIILP